jgi:hypothetical protein
VDLDRQPVPTRGNEPPQRVPETKPPLLGDWFIYLSVVILFAGVIAITALELGNDLHSPIVLVPAILAAVLLAIVAADGALRTWRSAWAWLPIFGPRAVQRFLWTGVLLAVMFGALGLILYLLFR